MIEKSFEHKFALKFIGIFSAFTGIIIMTLYVTLSGHEINNYAESIRLFATSRNAIQTSITTAYVIETIIALFLIIFIAVFASHKIAGPIYHIQRVLNDLLRNFFYMRPVIFRKNDQLEDIATGFNAMLTGLEDRFGAINIAYEELDKKKKELGDGEQQVREMRERLDKLDQAIQRFDV